jgi:hypothetical protein
MVRKPGKPDARIRSRSQTSLDESMQISVAAYVIVPPMTKCFSSDCRLFHFISDISSRDKKSLGGNPRGIQDGSRCCKCQQLITSGEGFGYICLKIPDKEGYYFFHCRFRRRDRLKENRKAQKRPRP